MINTKHQRRWLNLAGVCAVVGLIAYALFAQHVLGLEACPLCIFQRVAFITGGLVFLVAGLHSPGGVSARFYGALALAANVMGGAVAARHVYIQNLPADQVPPDCGAGLDYMLYVFGPFEAVRMVLTSAGECADISWQFLGLSMPGWAFVWFVLLGALAVAANWTRLPN